MYAIRHYAHNCLRRDKNKLLAGAYLSAGTRGFDRHLLLTVLVQRLQIQFRRTFSDAKGNRFRMRRVDLLRQRFHEKKRGPTFSKLFYRRTPARRERSTLWAANTIDRKKKVRSVLEVQRKLVIKLRCGMYHKLSHN